MQLDRLLIKASASFSLLCLASVALAQSAGTSSQPAAPANRCPGSTAQSQDHWWFPVDAADDTLPCWLQFDGEHRTRLEAQDGIKYGPGHDLYLLSRLRLSITVRPSRWLSFSAQTQDSRIVFNQVIASGLPVQNRWDLRQAYAQIGSSTEGWADLVVGRQVFSFGDERVIGPSDWLNAGRTFDAVRLNLHHAGNKVSVFASSVVVGRDGVVDHHVEGNNLYGIYGSFQHIVPKATVEPYVFWKVAPSVASLSGSSFAGSMSETTAGLRIAGTLPASFTYTVEMDRQTGSIGVNPISAWAGYWSLARTFDKWAWSPKLYVESNYASGTKNPNGGTWRTFDQLYPSSHDKLEFADQIGRRNIQQIRAGIQERINKKLKLTQAYESFWLATTHDALYSSSGSVSIAADPNAPGRHVGQELDLIGEYQVNSGITLGLGYARLFSGGFLRAATGGKDFQYPFVYLNYHF